MRPEPVMAKFTKTGMAVPAFFHSASDAAGNPAASDALWKNAGTAIPVFVNFAITGSGRIVRDLRAALTRRQREQLLATRAAQAALRNELTGAISGILLSSELALAQPAVPS